ncbi:MAG TPA: HAMP domain-containing sensor histidine kinase [Bryobacteraceae bacterium]|nr:HAMP domain-containing sensor histidine kinase [Bryobacteraceae bacterium]
MKNLPYPRGSLLFRILGSTSLAVTLVFALTGWMLQRHAVAVSEYSLEEEIRTSLQAYESLWGARIHNLMAISRIMSSMPDVRAAFMTRDQATIRDTAEQMWSEVNEGSASFLVLDPTGQMIASLGGSAAFSADPAMIRAARTQFPKQVSGYARRSAHLFYVVLTPVYVQAESGQALLDVLLIAFNIDNGLATELKRSTHGSDFAFISSQDVIASTLPGISTADLRAGHAVRGGVRRMKLRGTDYLLLATDLRNASGKNMGELFVIRSFAGPQLAVAELRRNVAVLWTAGICVALGLMYLLSKRVLEPVKKLDRAAAEVSRGNYGYRVPAETEDELGRLANTFNEMCDSIQKAREDLIRQEQIATIGRLSGSIVHDLRNPLAAIYGGAEMLMGGTLSDEQQQRLIANIYGASGKIRNLLQELLDVSSARNKPVEVCRLSDIAAVARDGVSRQANHPPVKIHIDIPDHINVLATKERLERVFVNLANNAVDAMRGGGELKINYCRIEKGQVIVAIEDTGPGIPEEAWPTLFHPFATFRKKNGLGLGLALSRQTLLETGGDLWAERNVTAGARFIMRLPIASDGPEKLRRTGGRNDGHNS